MFISKAMFDTMNGLIEKSQDRNTEMLRREGALRQKIEDLERMNARLQSDLDWFKLRLNHTELERAQLIQAAIGVKTSVPQFVPAQDPEATLAELPDFSTVGEDAASQESLSESDDLSGVDYSLMPGYKKTNKD